ncbi:Piwi-domain-containing protein [Hymenopellis radicata]|nr:Piwi-domain-containing protein [Hymenopellis radicata]
MSYNSHGQGSSRGIGSGGSSSRGGYRGGPSDKPYGRPPGGKPLTPPRVAHDELIHVRTNTFKITKLPQEFCYQYKLQFEPEVKTPERRVQLFHKLQNVVAPNVFGRRNVLFDKTDLVFSFGLLQLTEGSTSNGQFNVDLDTDSQASNPHRRSKVFRITFSMTSSPGINISTIPGLLQLPHSDPRKSQLSNILAPATNILQLIIRQETDQKYPHNKNAFFMSDHKDNQKLLYPNREPSSLLLWKGFFQSVKPTLHGVIINVDVSMAAIYVPQSALTTAMEFLQLRPHEQNKLILEPRHTMFQSLRRHLKGLRINVKSTSRQGSVATRTIRDLDSRGAMYEFVDRDGRRITVADHFRRMHNIGIQYPRIVSVVLSKPDAPHPVIVPLEVCTILPNQIYRKRLPSELTAQAVTFGTTRPLDRWKAITGQGRDGRRDIYAQTPILGYSGSPHVIASGMEIETRPLEVSGTILRPPQVTARRVLPHNNDHSNDPEHILDIDSGTGAWNYMKHGFFTPARLVNWCLVNFEPSSPNLEEKTIDGLVSRCQRLGMYCTRPTVIVRKHASCNVKEALDDVGHAFTSRMGPNILPSILIVILPQIAAEAKHAVKYWGDIIQGIPTQCIRSDKVDKAKDQYWANVAQKVNTRLGGLNGRVNSSILEPWREKQSPYMIVGADVAHAPPNVQRPSYVGLAWSRDPYASIYEGNIRMQDPRTERIQDLGTLIKSAVEKYQRGNKFPPQRIIFFRDGLSDAEFASVGGPELQEMKAALLDLYKPWNQAAEDFNRTAAPSAKRTIFPLISYIFVVKRHHIKFFPPVITPGQENEISDKNGNVRPGFVTADPQIRHPKFIDFYLQSHAAIQGTARSARHLIYHDENFGFDYKKVERLSFDLCHVYASASRSISLNAPVYYADKICGRAQYHHDPDNRDISFGSDAGSMSETFDLAAWRKGFYPPRSAVSTTFYL